MDADFLAYDSQLQEYIPFSNCSDAKVARLALTHNLTPRSIDLFLQLLRDEHFNPQDITFCVATDIYTHVSRYQIRRAEVRENNVRDREMELATTSSTHFRPIILDLVIDELVRERNLSWDKEDLRILRNTLLAMTYVHRTWTIRSQRALGKFTSVNFSTDVRKAMCSPVLGFWTTRARYIYPSSAYKHYNPGDYLPRADIEEGTYASKFVYPQFQQLSQLTLAVTYDDVMTKIPYLERSLEGLRYLEQLQELNVDVSQSSRFLARICTILPYLHKLRKLVIACRTPYHKLEINDEITIDSLTDYTPPRLLRDVTLSTDFIWSNTSHLPFFEWIVRPRPDQCIKKLSFHGANAAFSETVSKCTQIVDLITPCFQNLEELELHTDVFLNENSQEKIEFYHHVLSHCKAIRHLIICDRVRFHRDEEKMLKVKRVVAGIAEHASSTLEEVWLGTYCRNGMLYGFEQIGILKCDMKLIWSRRGDSY